MTATTSADRPQDGVGSRIRERREALGISRSDLASQIRRTEEAVAFYEEGDLVPSGPVLAVFAQALGLASAELMDDQVRAVDATIARNLGEGPIVPPGRRAALIALLAPQGR